MYDSYDRQLNYLRISVTDRCNLNCHYCRPEGQVELLPAREILSLEEIAEVARAAVAMGIDKIRLTGGEPLLRRNLVQLVRLLAGIPGVTDLSMTTNGTLLPQYAVDLKLAGLNRVNISLDTVDPVDYKRLTRGGDLEEAITGVRAARDTGLTPVKLNCVIEQSSSEPAAQQVARFATEEDVEIRFIRRMHIERGEFWIVEGGSGGDCDNCNRLRLTSNGVVHPCLFNDIGFSVRELGAVEALIRAAAAKPASGKEGAVHLFSRIGG
jgi:GTP 3',8-cyclase